MIIINIPDISGNNRWDNYTGNDADNNRIGNASHSFTGGIDYLPIWDEAPPHIKISSYTLFYSSTPAPPHFEVIITDPYIDTMWYTIMGSNQIFTFTSNGTIDHDAWQLAWNSVPNGWLITIRFYANDTFGHITYQDITAIKLDSAEFIFWAMIIMVGVATVIGGVLVVRRIRTKKVLQPTLIKKKKFPLERTEPFIPMKAQKLKMKEAIPEEIDLTEEEKLELEKVESEVGIEKRKFICVVHKGPIIGANYLCPNCHTFYCVKCARALKDNGEHCWSCDNEIELE